MKRKLAGLLKLLRLSRKVCLDSSIDLDHQISSNLLA